MPTEKRTLYAWIALNEDGQGGEGIMGYASGGGGMLPLVAGTHKAVMLFRPLAQRIVRVTGKVAALRRYDYTGTIDTIEP